MKKDCEKYQSKLIDIFYNEEIMNDELQNHRESCYECKEFWDGLHQMNLAINKGSYDPPIEYGEISQAFQLVENIKEKRRNLLDLALFIIISGLILGLVAFVAVNGYVIQIIYFQLIMYMIIPLTLPVIIKIRSFKESYDERY